MKNYILTSVLLLATGFANAQYFQYLYGTTNTEFLSGDGINTYQTGTLGHFMASPTFNGSTSTSGLSLVAELTDVNGIPSFNNVYHLLNPLTGGTQVDVWDAHTVEFNTPAGGYGIVGSYQDPSTGVYEVYYVPLTPGGVPLPSYQFFPAAPFGYTSLNVTSVTPSLLNPADFYICGGIIDAAGYNHVFAIKLNQFGGAIIWSQIYDLNVASATNKEWTGSILESAVPNTSIIGSPTEVMIVGSTLDLSPTDAFVLRVDQATGLVTQPTQTYGTAARSEGFNSIKNSNNPNVKSAAAQNGYVLCGLSDINIASSFDMWNVAIDEAGVVKWSNVFDYNNSGPTLNQDEGIDLFERLVVGATNSYEYYIASYTSAGFYGMTDKVVTKLDGFGNGVAMGQFTYGASMADAPWRIQDASCTAEPGISLYSYTFNPTAPIGGFDHHLITAHYNGVTACNYNLQNIIQTPGPGNLALYNSGIIGTFNISQLICQNPFNGLAKALCVPNSLYFQSTYGTPSTENIGGGHNVYTNGLGHFLVGTSDAFSVTSMDIEVQRTDQLGNTTTGPNYFNNIYKLMMGVDPLSIRSTRSVEFTDGSGFGIAGSYYNTNTGAPGIFYTNLSATGVLGAVKGFALGGAGGAFAYDVTAVKQSAINTNFIYVCGNMFIGNLQKIFVMKINHTTGLVAWRRVYDLDPALDNSDVCADLVESAYINSSSGVYEVLVVGNTWDPANGTDAFVLRVNNANGATIGNVQLYGGAASYDKFTAIDNASNPNITPTSDGYILAGYSNDKASGDMDFWQVAIDQAGVVAWSNMFDYNNGGASLNEDLANDVVERLNSCGDYEYYMGGQTNIGVMGGADAVVIKTDGLGNGLPTGQFTYGTPSQEFAVNIDEFNFTTTDGIALYGNSYLNAALGNEQYLVKAYFNGVTACQYDLRNVFQAAGPGATLILPPVIINTLVNVLLTGFTPATAADNMLCSAPSIANGDNRREGFAGSGKTTPTEAGLTNIVLYPNPSTSNGTAIDLKLVSDQAQQGTITIVDVLGREYFKGTFELSKGDNTLHVLPQGTNMAKGTYFVSIRTATDTRKIILLVQ